MWLLSGFAFAAPLPAELVRDTRDDLRRALPGCHVVRAGRELDARCPDGVIVRVDLDAVAARCTPEPNGCDGPRLAAVVAALPVDLTHVVPVPRARSQVDGTLALITRVGAEGRDASDRAPIHARLAADVEILYMLDGSEHLIALNVHDLTTLAMEEGELRAATVANCARYAGDVTRETDGGVEVWTGGIWLSGLVLDPARWAAEAGGGPLLLAIPGRDTLLVLRDLEPTHVEHLRSLALRANGDAQVPISSAVLRWTGSGWEEWSDG